jgi:hypothetical protein
MSTPRGGAGTRSPHTPACRALPLAHEGEVREGRRWGPRVPARAQRRRGYRPCPVAAAGRWSTKTSAGIVRRVRWPQQLPCALANTCSSTGTRPHASSSLCSHVVHIAIHSCSRWLAPRCSCRQTFGLRCVRRVTRRRHQRGLRVFGGGPPHTRTAQHSTPHPLSHALHAPLPLPHISVSTLQQTPTQCETVKAGTDAGATTTKRSGARGWTWRNELAAHVWWYTRCASGCPSRSVSAASASATSTPPSAQATRTTLPSYAGACAAVHPPLPMSGRRSRSLWFGKPPLEIRAKAAARLDLEVSAGWSSPSSRGL